MYTHSAPVVGLRVVLRRWEAESCCGLVLTHHLLLARDECFGLCGVLTVHMTRARVGNREQPTVPLSGDVRPEPTDP